MIEFADPVEARLKYLELIKKGVRCIKYQTGRNKNKRYIIEIYSDIPNPIVHINIREPQPGLYPMRASGPRDSLQKHIDDNFKDYDKEY